jgi:hypothetical protein
MTWKVDLWESERGWGQKRDEIREFETFAEAEDFAKEFNARNDKPVTPDWYMYAGDPYCA